MRRRPETHPRGEPTWPDWKQAAPGTRVEHVRSGRTGTFVRVSRNRHNGALIDWDDVGFGPSRGYVVAAAFDLRPLSGAESATIRSVSTTEER